MKQVKEFFKRADKRLLLLAALVLFGFITSLICELDFSFTAAQFTILFLMFVIILQDIEVRDLSDKCIKLAEFSSLHKEHVNSATDELEKKIAYLKSQLSKQQDKCAALQSKLSAIKRKTNTELNNKSDEHKREQRTGTKRTSRTTRRD